MNSDSRPHRAPKSRQGFTLIETIIALVILSVGILAVATLSSTSIWQVRRGQDLTNAAMAAQQVMEQIATTPFDSVALGTDSDTVTMGGIQYTVVWTVTDVTDSLASGNAQLKSISVYTGGGLTLSSAEVFEMMLFSSGGAQ